MRTLRLSLLLALIPALAVAQATPATPATPRTHARAWPDTGLKVERGADRAQATFSLDSARALALRTVPGGTIRSSELEQEHGKLIYSFDVKVPGKRGIEEVNIDAKSGAVVGREHENEADEHAESRQEHAPRPATAHPAAKPATAPAHP
jgi:hypothetical protein